MILIKFAIIDLTIRIFLKMTFRIGAKNIWSSKLIKYLESICSSLYLQKKSKIIFLTCIYICIRQLTVAFDGFFKLALRNVDLKYACKDIFLDAAVFQIDKIDKIDQINQLGQINKISQIKLKNQVSQTNGLNRQIRLNRLAGIFLT